MFNGLILNVRQSFRLLARSKVYTTINLTGLTVGFSVTFLLLIFAVNELNVNKFTTQYNELYRVILTDRKGYHQPLGPYRLKEIIKAKVPLFSESFRIVNIDNMVGEIKLRIGSKKIQASNFICADPEIFQCLEIEMVNGTPPTENSDCRYIYFSTKIAQNIFSGQIKPEQKIIAEINGNNYPLTIGGIYKSITTGSTIRADFITSPELYLRLLQATVPESEFVTVLHDDFAFETYVRSAKNLNQGSFGNISARLTRMVFPDQENRVWFQPFASIYMQSGNIRNDFIKKGKEENVYLFLTLAFFILFLASINYSLLTTARAAMRFKEIGVRKVLGSSSGQIKFQLISESLLLTIIAFPLSFIFLGLIVPGIESIFPGQFFFYSSNLFIYLLITFGVTILAGLLSGSYVSFYLSSIDTITALKSNYFFLKKVTVSKIFIIIQLFITTALFIALIIVSQQLKFLLEPVSGINKSNLITLPVDGDPNGYIKLKTALSKSPYLQAVSGSAASIPTNAIQENQVTIPNSKSKQIKLETVFIDTGFFNTLNIPVIKIFPEDRTISKNKMQFAYLNEEGYASLNLSNEDPITIGAFTIAGIVPDFSIHTLHQKINPTLFIVRPDACRSLIIRYKEGFEKEFFHDLRRSHFQIQNGAPLTYQFFNDELKILYVREQNFERIIGIFTLAAFIITGMGLFGLAMLITEQRMREMSIRKVFGARARTIIILLQKDFIIASLISSVIAIPVACFLITIWLRTFHYHVAIQWYMVILACTIVSTFVSTILFFKTLRILKESPSFALKYE